MNGCDSKCCPVIIVHSARQAIKTLVMYETIFKISTLNVVNLVKAISLDKVIQVNKNFSTFVFSSSMYSSTNFS
jgi:DNA integrity scanning protein DisA with diadenylate cyclase activity